MVTIRIYAAAKRRSLFVVAVGLVCTLAACANDITPTPGPRPEPTRLMAYGSGRLGYQDGCLFMGADGSPDRPSALVWPPDIIPTVDEQAGVVEVELPNGAITTVKLGDLVLIPGGEVTGPNSEERDVIGKRSDGSQPDHCPPPYWLVSDFRPATPTPPSADGKP